MRKIALGQSQRAGHGYWTKWNHATLNNFKNILNYLQSTGGSATRVNVWIDGYYSQAAPAMRYLIETKVWTLFGFKSDQHGCYRMHSKVNHFTSIPTTSDRLVSAANMFLFNPVWL
jgi:hypothetical protein